MGGVGGVGVVGGGCGGGRVVHETNNHYHSKFSLV